MLKQLLLLLLVTLSHQAIAQKGKAVRVAIGDTVLVKGSGEIIPLTEGAPKEFQLLNPCWFS